MLSIFHTADWHLGQSFCGYDRAYEHGCFLGWLLTELQAHQPDALIVAGDVFDSINPSAAAQKRFYNFLAKTCAEMPGLQIVLTAGNHDAGARLEAPAELLESFNISVVGTVKQDDSGIIDASRFLVSLKDRAGIVQAIVMAVPFLRPSDVPSVENAADPYLDGVRELYRRTTEAADALRQELNPDAALIAMGHCHLDGGEESRESERRLVVGGAEAIAPDGFDSRIAYVAPGHLHLAQHFDGGRIRFSGSPIPLSFSETDYQHQILKVTFNGMQLQSVEEVRVPRVAMLLRIPAEESAPIEDVLPQLAALRLDEQLPLEQYPFLEVRITEQGPDPMRRRRVEQAIEGKPVRLASIKVERAERDASKSGDDQIQPHLDLKSVDPQDIFLDAWRERYGIDPDSRVVAAFREILLAETRDG